MHLAAALGRLATLGAASRPSRIERRAPASTSPELPGPIGLEKVTATVVAATRVQPGDVVIDLGCGRGNPDRRRHDVRARRHQPGPRDHQVEGTVAGKEGIGGWWRIAKNSYRYLVQVKEHPVSISAWTAMFATAGFTGITSSRIVKRPAW